MVPGRQLPNCLTLDRMGSLPLSLEIHQPLLLLMPSGLYVLPRQGPSLGLCVTQCLLMICFFFFPLSLLIDLQRHTLSNPEPSSFQLQAQRLEQEDLFFKGPRILLSDL